MATKKQIAKQKKLITTKFSETFLEDRDMIKLLKRALIEKQSYDLAADIRDLERSLFPVDDTYLEERKEAATFLTVLQIAEFTIKESETAYVLLELAKLYLDKGDTVDIAQIADIRARTEKIFK